jgi:hypothetical protein
MAESSLSVSKQLRRKSHEICALILNSDEDWIDIEIKITQMRNICIDEMPDKIELFEQVYVKRFERLRDQWRFGNDDDPGTTDGRPSWMEGLDWLTGEKPWSLDF